MEVASFDLETNVWVYIEIWRLAGLLRLGVLAV
jgi:hypothetical protein